MQSFYKNLNRIYLICNIVLTFVLLNLLPAKAMITDEFAESFPAKNTNTPMLIADEFSESNTKHSEKFGKYMVEEESNNNSLKLRAKEQITTKTKPEKGDNVYFELAENFNYNGKVYPVGTPVKARIKTVSMNANWGTPAEIIIGNLSIDGVPVGGKIIKTGKNKTFLARSLAITGTIFFGTGFFFMFIKGGHAKIKPDEMLTVYF